MGKITLFIFLSVYFAQAQAWGTQQLRFLQPVESADIYTRNSVYSKHIIGLIDGRVFPEAVVFGRGCTLRLTYGSPARVSEGEKMRMIDKNFTYTKAENCLEWQTDVGGEQVCVKFGDPSPLALMELQLVRENGERPVLLCSGLEMRTEKEILQLFKKTLGSIAIYETF